jgi:hypothetical protein
MKKYGSFMAALVLVLAVLLAACVENNNAGGGGGSAGNPNGQTAQGGAVSASGTSPRYSPETDFSYVLDTTFSEGESIRIIRITGYTGSDSRVVIPPTIEGYPVEQIDRKAFVGSYKRGNVSTPGNADRITEIVLPNSIKFIFGEAFYCCWNLTTINISAQIFTIGKNAFYQCTELRNVSIPDSVDKIRYNAADEYRDGLFWNEVFVKCDKLPIATRERLRILGENYKNSQKD